MSALDYKQVIVSDTGGKFTFVMSKALQRRLADEHIYLNYTPGEFALPDGARITAPTGPHVEPFSVFASRTICRAGFSGFFASPLTPNTRVGRYCSVARNVLVMGANHPLDRITTSTFTYRAVSNGQIMPVSVLQTAKVKTIPHAYASDPIMEHDVWIGQNVLLKPGIRIGTGSVIAAGSVVVKDVPPYAIVGGNPARIIRYRFDEQLIEKFLEIRWWEYAFPHFGDLPFDEPDRFLDMLACRVADGSLTPYSPEPIDLFQIVTEFYGLVPPDFSEENYLRHNPDVQLAVSAKRLHSGRQHYARTGRNEGRVWAATELRPVELDAELLVKA